MASPDPKRRKMSDEEEEEEDQKGTRKIPVQLKSETGEVAGAQFDMPVNVTANQLQQIVNAVLKKEEQTPYSFFVGETEITGNLDEALSTEQKESGEAVLDIVYQPQAVFKVRAVTRCTSTIEGHAEAVLAVQFSPDGRYLASGSGDKTVRFWDTTTETPQFTCKGHQSWILAVAFSPDGKKVASGCKNGEVCIWDPQTGKQIGKAMNRHTKFITNLAWKPMHLDPECRYVASSSKDATIKIWDTRLCKFVISLSSHTQSVMSMRWGGTNLIYSASQDRTIKVWRAEDGVLCRTLQGHGHWVNTMALSTDYALRTGAYDPAHATIVPQDNDASLEELKQKAQQIFDKTKGEGAEILVTGSDDFTLCLWKPETEKKPINRMTGHQQLVNQVLFSPDARIVASASFDKSVKLWCGKTGKFLATLRGHVSRVYRVAWSADSRLLCSGSADSTLKVWDVQKKKLLCDLPGHADAVFALDWSPDGQRVASGGKDKVLKIWRQ